MVCNQAPVRRGRRFWVAGALAGLLAFGQPATAKPILKGGQGSWTVSEFVATTPKRAWAILSNYEAQPGFAPDIVRSNVVQRDGSTVVLDHSYKAGYTFGLTIKARLSIRERPPTGFSYTLIEGQRLNSLKGSWTITPVKGGVQLRHQIQVNPQVPFLLRPIYDQEQEANLVEWMTILKRRMEKGG
jgi:hypothetical protein